MAIELNREAFMRRRVLVLQIATIGGAFGLSRRAAAFGLSETDAAAGVRAALERGAISAINLLGRTDGFLGNPKVRIPLPESLQDAAGLLRTFGQQKRLDQLVTSMNRAAESAMPEARTLLISTVKAMSVDDALKIITGGENSVTSYFSDKTRAPLETRFLPIMTRATERVSLASKYNTVAQKAAGLGLLKPEDASIQQYVTRKAVDGLFLMIGEEERKIRENPVSTGSAILKKVFGSLK